MPRGRHGEKGRGPMLPPTPLILLSQNLHMFPNMEAPQSLFFGVLWRLHYIVRINDIIGHQHSVQTPAPASSQEVRDETESSKPLSPWLGPLASGLQIQATLLLSESHLINIKKDTFVSLKPRKSKSFQSSEPETNKNQVYIYQKSQYQYILTLRSDVSSLILLK